jgi:hypothetical protein
MAKVWPLACNAIYKSTRIITDKSESDRNRSLSFLSTAQRLITVTSDQSQVKRKSTRILHLYGHQAERGV